MTIAVTRNLPDRFDGFIKSCMLEIAPGVYAVPQMRKSVRERLWKVMLEWAELIPADGGLVLFWKSAEAPSGLGLRILGWPQKELIEHEGIWVTFQSLTKAHDKSELKKLLKEQESDNENDPDVESY